MQKNTNTESPLLDTDDWEIAFTPYAQDHRAALVLGYNFMILKSYLLAEPLMVQEAIQSIDLAFVATIGTRLSLVKENLVTSP